MLWAIATLVCFTLGGFSGSKCAQWTGGLAANRWRITLALPVMLIIGAVTGSRVFFPTAWLFILGGTLHLGIGDAFLYTGYNRIGPRLTMLIALCSSPVISWCLEWFFMHSTPDLREIIPAACIVGGVIIALAPAERRQFSPQGWRAGIAASVMAGIFLSTSAVVTRFAMHQTHDAGIETNLMITAMYRVIGGAVLLNVVGATVMPTTWKVARTLRQRFAAWMALSVVIGPVIGMAVYHEALNQHNSAVVQAVLSMMPIAVIPLAWAINKDRPSLRAIVGALISVGACAVLVLM
jgi:drug/metabolite transporter (DMT)-like permease